MHKRLYFSIATFALCLTLLVGVFLVLPNVTHASSVKMPISVTQPSDCTQITAIGNAQMCDMVVSLQHNASQNVHFSVSDSGVYCYATCGKPTSVSGTVFTSEPEGNTLKTTNDQMPIVIIVPLSIHGSLTITFVVKGPSNSVKTQLVITNTCC